MSAKPVEVKQKEGEEIPVEILASSIVEIAAAMKKISASRLNRKALLVLIAHQTKIPQYQVEYVINTLEQLEDIYCRPRHGKGS